jgi:hypothetical protein
MRQKNRLHGCLCRITGVADQALRHAHRCNAFARLNVNPDESFFRPAPLTFAKWLAGLIVGNYGSQPTNPMAQMRRISSEERGARRRIPGRSEFPRSGKDHPGKTGWKNREATRQKAMLLP